MATDFVLCKERGKDRTLPVPPFFAVQSVSLSVYCESAKTLGYTGVHADCAETPEPSSCL